MLSEEIVLFSIGCSDWQSIFLSDIDSFHSLLQSYNHLILKNVTFSFGKIQQKEYFYKNF